MTDTTFYTYRAFISYSHADSARCDWLHRALESYRVDRDLVGCSTPDGPVPRRLAPVFRDRTDFSTGLLKEQTLAALGQSQFLIIIASPHAARSTYVNEEIRAFKAQRGGASHICALIVEGAPPDIFPPALRYRVTKDGTITGEPDDDVLAGDLTKDGEREALVTIVAGLLGRLPRDHVRMRDVEAQKKRNNARAGFAAAFGVAILAAGIFGYGQYGVTTQVSQHETQLADQRDKLAKVEATLKTLLATQSAQAAPGQREEVRGALENIADGAARGDERLKRALALLGDGKVAEAEPLLRAEAADREQRITRQQAQIAADRRAAATAWRNLGAIAALRDPKNAREAYSRAVELDPENAEGLAWNGWLQMRAGNLPAAEQSYRTLHTLSNANESFQAWAYLGLGEIAQDRGNLTEAITHYRDALAIAERVATARKDETFLSNEVSSAHRAIGDALFARGDLSDALASYQTSLSIDETLARSEPDVANWRYNSGQSHERIGDMLEAQGKLDEAMEAYRRKLEIIQEIVSSNPTNPWWRRDLGVALNRIGSSNLLAGNRAESLKFFRDALEIYEKLAADDSYDLERQQDLAVVYVNIGWALLTPGALTAAMENLQHALRILERIASMDTRSNLRQEHIALTYMEIAKAMMKQGKPAEALDSYRRSFSINERIAERDPMNAKRQHNLERSLAGMGDGLLAQGEKKEALAKYQQALAIGELLVAQGRSNAQWRLVQIDTYMRISVADPTEARIALSKARSALVELRDAGRLNPRNEWMIGNIDRRLERLQDDDD